jgi:hypothetical protein
VLHCQRSGRSIAFYRDVLGLALVITEQSEASPDDRSDRTEYLWN